MFVFVCLNILCEFQILEAVFALFLELTYFIQTYKYKHICNVGELKEFHR